MKNIQLKHYSLIQHFSCLFELVYISYVFQSLVGLTVSISILEASYQILFRLKLLAVYSYILLFVYLKLLEIFTRLKLSFIIYVSIHMFVVKLYFISY